MVKIGLLGAGKLGKIHLSQLLTIPECEVVGFFDPDEQTAIEVSEKFSVKKFPDVASLLQACDAVDIVSSTPTHFMLAEQAIRAGKHVFVEKPMCSHLAEAEALIKLINEAHVCVQVGHVERFNPAFLALKNFALQPMFIEVHRLAQFQPRNTETSVILDLMIHDIDIILHLVPSEVHRISASGVAVLSESTDIANARIEFENGCVANLTSSRISMKKMRKMRLFQKDAYIGIDFLQKKTEIIHLLPPVNHENNGLMPTASGLSFELDTPHGKRRVAVDYPPVEDTNAIRMELQLFCQSILHNKPVAVNAMEAYRALKTAYQILEKIQKNTPVIT
ncbi:MAG: Gfo/Idh/MocA family oxidoreductase [Thermoflavifilum sp.]|nr:Gfo/Idh/MocA family oxidoreductase [Thermoflavifilum sp.]